MEKKKLTFIISFIILCVFGILGLGFKTGSNFIDLNKLKTNNLVVNRQEYKAGNNENLLGMELTDSVNINKINATNTAKNINIKESVSVNASESEKNVEKDQIEHSQNETKRMIENNDNITQNNINNDNNTQSETNNDSKQDKTTISNDNENQTTNNDSKQDKTTISNDNENQTTNNDKIDNKTQITDNSKNTTTDNNKQNQTNLDSQTGKETTITDDNREKEINKESGEIENSNNDNNKRKENKKDKKRKIATDSDTPYDNVLDKSVHHKENVLNKPYRTLESLDNEKEIMLIDEDRENEIKSHYKLKLNVNVEQEFDADCIELNYNITTKCDTVSQCMEEIKNKIRDLRTELQSIDNNIEIESQYYSCYPELDNGVTKQNCSYNISIKTCSVNNIDDIMKKCDSINANSCYCPEYKLKDEDTKKNEVLLKAIEKAKEKAKLVDSDLQLVQVEEGYSYASGENGKVKVRVNITAKFVK